MKGLVAAGSGCVIAAIINIAITAVAAIIRAVVGISGGCVAVAVHLLTSIAAGVVAAASSCLAAASIAVVIKTFLIILLVAVWVEFIGKAVHDCWLLFQDVKNHQVSFKLSA